MPSARRCAETLSPARVRSIKLASAAATALLPAVRAIQNIASGEPFTADQALAVGLVNAVGEAKQIEELAGEWLTKAARAGATMSTGRPSVYELEQLSLNDGLDEAFKRLSQAYQG